VSASVYMPARVGKREPKQALRDDGVVAIEWGDGIVPVACGVLYVECESPEHLDATEVDGPLVMVSGESAGWPQDEHPFLITGRHHD
jgi:hypothetical protein